MTSQAPPILQLKHETKVPKRVISPPKCITHNTFDARFVLTLGHPQDMLTPQSEIVESLHTDSFQIAD